MPQNIDAAGIGLQQPEAELEDRALARTRYSQQNFGLAALQFERDVVEHSQFIKTQGDVFEDNCLVDCVRRVVEERHVRSR